MPTLVDDPTMEILDRIKSFYLTAGARLTDNRFMEWKWFVEQEIDSWHYWVSFPLRRRLWLWRHGFPSPYGKLYDIETHGPSAFLSELQRYRLYNAMNGNHRYLVDDKLSQHWMLSDYPSNRPDAHGLIDQGTFHGSSGTTFDEGPLPISEVVPSLVRTHEKLVFKQLRGKAGKEVLICEYNGGYLLDDEPISETALVERLSDLDHYLVTEYVQQHAYAEALYPHSPNTIRLLTLWDDRSGELLVPFAAHRIGTDRSRPIDNFSAGGLSAEIDISTGELGSAVQFPFDGDVTWYDVHPDTGAPLKGSQVPGWTHIRDTVEAIATANANVPAIGWDIVVDRSGEPVVIEANTGTDFDMVQVHRPLLDDPAVRRIAARHLPEVDLPVEV